MFESYSRSQAKKFHIQLYKLIYIQEVKFRLDSFFGKDHFAIWTTSSAIIMIRNFRKCADSQNEPLYKIGLSKIDHFENGSSRKWATSKMRQFFMPIDQISFKVSILKIWYVLINVSPRNSSWIRFLNYLFNWIQATPLKYTSPSPDVPPPYQHPLGIPLKEQAPTQSAYVSHTLPVRMSYLPQTIHKNDQFSDYQRYGYKILRAVYRSSALIGSEKWTCIIFNTLFQWLYDIIAK